MVLGRQEITFLALLNLSQVPEEPEPQITMVADPDSNILVGSDPDPHFFYVYIYVYSRIY